MGSIHILSMIYMNLNNILNEHLKNTPCCICKEIETRTKKCFTCKESYPYKRSLRHMVYYNKLNENQLKEALKTVDVICFSCLYQKKDIFTPKHDNKQYPLAKKQYRNELISWFRDVRANGTCHECGKPASAGTYKEFQYHHIDPKNKKCEVSFMVQQCNSKELIELEMKKCVLLCRQCHIKKHHN
ncbi:MAG: hypothetical protein KA467_00215 [Bacteroidales bacterium]|nr:hypothetical protein [Bacteroidales bacterium]